MTAAHLAAAIAVGTAVSLLATPLARRLALKTGLLDRPGEHKSHVNSTPYLGGLAIMVATTAGALIAGGFGWTTWRVLLAATLIGGVGLADDVLNLQPLPRLACQILAAGVVLSGGVRFEVTGSPMVDGAFSLVWLVGLTNAFNLLDNMDGLCAGTAALACLGVAGVALAAGQVALAVTALAVVGACVGFLAFNLAPASIFMGDAGSMFLGALVASIALAAHPAGPALVHLAVPVLIVALPLLDTIAVTLGRARRGKSVMLGGRDHLSHRLVQLGRTRSGAVGVLLAVEAAAVVAGVFVARGLLNPWLASAAAAALLGAVYFWTGRAAVYQEPVIGLPRMALWVVSGAGAFILVISAPAILAMARARGALQAGALAVQAGIRHDQGGQSAAASQDFVLAAASFSTAKHRLDGFGVRAGRVVPVVAVNLRAATVLARVGLDLSRSGQELAGDADVRSLRIQQGTVPLDLLARLAPRLKSLDARLSRSSDQVHRLPRTLLVGQIRQAVDGLDTRLTKAARQVHQSDAAATTAPAMLGSKGARRYLLLIQNNAESRATGGLIGNFGELIVEGGRISLGRFGRNEQLSDPPGTRGSVPAPADYVARYGQFSPFDLWQNVNLSPDFPTVGQVTAALYPKSGGQRVDGVIGVDPIALSNFLRLTGPIRVASWPEPITADNVVQVTLQQAYDALPNDSRVAFLGDVARATFAALTSHDLGNPVQVGQALGSAVVERHLQFYMTDPAQEAFISQIGASGAFGSVHGDQLLLTTQNSAANKVDYYLKRAIDYQVNLSPRSDPQHATGVGVRGTLTIRLTNRAPADGHSPDALGPYEPGFQPGENRTFLSVYSPLTISPGTLDGAAMKSSSGEERGQHVVSSFVSIPAESTRTIAFKVGGSIRLDSQGWYTLQLPRQPALGTDDVSLSFRVPAGWEVQAGGGAGGWGRATTVTLKMAAPTRIRLRIRTTGLVAWLSPLPGSQSSGSQPAQAGALGAGPFALGSQRLRRRSSTGGAMSPLSSSISKRQIAPTFRDRPLGRRESNAK